MKEPLLFFYLNTGGGHLAPVRAIAESLRATYPGRVEPVLIDGMANAGGFARYIIVEGYRITQARAKWIYESAYAITKFPPAASANSALVSRALREGIEQAILKHQPKGIVISHFFLIAPILDILQRRRLAIPTVTIVTDPYTAHPLWFLQKSQTMVVFSETLKESAVRQGISPERVHVFPFILNPRFNRNASQQHVDGVKAGLGFRTDQRLVLLLGGSDGMPRGLRIVREILHQLPEVGIVLVCGRNKSLFRRAEKLALTAEGRNLRAFAYVENVPELIALCDTVLTKGGASTVMEIIAMGKIPVITTYIWEQEKGNVEFVVNEHRGVYENRIGRLPAVITGIFDDSPPFRQIREKNRTSPIKSGTPAVAEFILEHTGIR